MSELSNHCAFLAQQRSYLRTPSLNGLHLEYGDVPFQGGRLLSIGEDAIIYLDVASIPSDLTIDKMFDLFQRQGLMVYDRGPERVEGGILRAEDSLTLMFANLIQAEQ